MAPTSRLLRGARWIRSRGRRRCSCRCDGDGFCCGHYLRSHIAALVHAPGPTRGTSGKKRGARPLVKNFPFSSLFSFLINTQHNIHQHLQVLVGRTSGRLFSRPIFQALATKIGLKRDPMMVFILYLCVTEYFTTLMILLND